MLLTSLLELRALILQHNEETGHEILPVNDPRLRRVGFACLECEDDAHTWELQIPGAYEGAHPTLDELNVHTQERTFGDAFFEHRVEDAGLIPVGQLEPEAEDMRWAVEHINARRPPRGEP